MHKILVVDDEPEILETVAELIEMKFSSGVDKAVNGLDAYLMAEKTQYDLIITDFKMPFMNGAAFIIATRTKETMNKKTPIIMLSGFIDDELKKNLGIQNVQFISKPFQPDDLFDLIRDQLI